MEELNLQEVIETKLLIEQHFHGAYGVDFATCKADEILFLAKKLLQHGIGGFFPTLATDKIENIKDQITEIKKAKDLQTEDMAEILGIHIEGIFLNPEKKGIHDETLFLKPTIENYKLIEDDLIKIVTLAPELDEDFKLSKYLTMKGVRVQAGHCIGGDLTNCHGATHIFNAMSGISHRGTSTALSALVNDDIYTEIIGDGIHLSDDILKLIFKSKPLDKIILIADCLPITYSDETEMNFCGKTVYYNGEKATSKDGTIAGSTKLLDKIIKTLIDKGFPALELIENTYKYHNIQLNGKVWRDENFNVIAVEKNGLVIYKED